MVQKIMIGILTALMVTLVACGSGEADTPATDTDTDLVQGEDFFNRALPEALQLQLGTLMLEETTHAVTPDQAQELLPSWQLLRALYETGTASQVEIEATVDQIQAAMTPEQAAAIEEMSLTMAEMRETMQELGIVHEDEFAHRREQGGQEGPGGFGPPGGMPGQGGQGMPGMPPGMDFSPEEMATRQIERMNSGFFGGTALLDALIQLLEDRAAEL